jgi:hypothetical protein
MPARTDKKQKIWMKKQRNSRNLNENSRTDRQFQPFCREKCPFPAQSSGQRHSLKNLLRQSGEMQAMAGGYRRPGAKIDLRQPTCERVWEGGEGAKGGKSGKV